jgi:hypothetical protein
MQALVRWGVQHAQQLMEDTRVGFPDSDFIGEHHLVEEISDTEASEYFTQFPSGGSAGVADDGQLNVSLTEGGEGFAGAFE